MISVRFLYSSVKEVSISLCAMERSDYLKFVSQTLRQFSSLRREVWHRDKPKVVNSILGFLFRLKFYTTHGVL